MHVYRIHGKYEIVTSMKLIEQCALKIKTYNEERVHLIFVETNKSSSVALDIPLARESDTAHATVNFSTIFLKFSFIFIFCTHTWCTFQGTHEALLSLQTIKVVGPITPQRSSAPNFRHPSGKQLLLNSFTLPHLALGKMKSWPKHCVEWKKCVDRLTPFYKETWMKLGIYQLMQMSKGTITL